MDRIKTQADKLWQIISNPSTTKTYQQTLTLTWSILKETGQLVWLVLCLGLVAGDWFWKKSYKTGQDTRVWVDTLQTKVGETVEGEGAEPTSTADILGETGKSLLGAGQVAATKALNTARTQLGLEPLPEPIKPAPAPPKAVTPKLDAKPASGAIAAPETPSESVIDARDDE
jgi:hypothetical protein